MIGVYELAVLAFFCAAALSLFVCGYILTDRRPLAHRFAWAAIALIFPVVGPILYVAFARIESPRTGAQPPPLPPRFTP